jgi:type IX secretion system PorP/SprF family membrane protein
MKKLLIICLMMMGGAALYGQQDPQYSQYMFNGLLLNPAYTGSRDLLSITAMGRYQWVGIEGAPRTATFSIHGPTPNEKSGFGFSMYHDRLGITRQMATNLSYAYRMSLGPGILALGLQGGVMSHLNKWSTATTVDYDQIAPLQNQTGYMPLAGAGAYYNTQRMYAGIAVPNLVRNAYKNPNSISGDLAAKQQRHLFATAGVVLPVSQDVEFKPSFVMKYTENAPIQFDLNAAFLFRETMWIGASYRTGDAVVFIAEYVFKNQYRIGYAYDLTVSKLANYNSGSHELMLGVDLGWSKSRIKTPRYF